METIPPEYTGTSEWAFTASDAWPVIVVVLVVLTLLGIWRIIRNDERNTCAGKPGRGSLPGRGYHLLSTNYWSFGSGATSRGWHVPKDPQEYAKAFVPGRNRKD